MQGCQNDQGARGEAGLSKRSFVKINSHLPTILLTVVLFGSSVGIIKISLISSQVSRNFNINKALLSVFHIMNLTDFLQKTGIPKGHSYEKDTLAPLPLLSQGNRGS